MSNFIPDAPSCYAEPPVCLQLPATDAFSEQRLPVYRRQIDIVDHMTWRSAQPEVGAAHRRN